MIRRQTATSSLSRALAAALALCGCMFAAALAFTHLDAAPLNISSLLPSSGSSQASQTAQPEFTAAHIATDRATGDIVATGNARLTQGATLITADEIRYNPKSQTATARGHVEVTSGPLRLLADEFVYHTADGSFTVTAPRFGEYPYYISGKQATGTVSATPDSGLRTPDSELGTPNSTVITLTDATVTLQQPGYALAPTLRADALTYTRDAQATGADRESIAARIHTTNTRLGLGSLSFLKLPRLSQSVDRSILAYFTVRAGYRGNLGEFLDLGALFPVADGLRLGGDAGFYTKRGLLIGPAAAYDITTADGQRITGSLDTGYIHDYGNRMNDILGRPIGFDRGFVTWKHDQTITPDLHAFGQVNYWSDSDIIRDFRSGQFYSVQQPDNFLEIDYTQPAYVLSVFARAALNSYYPVQQRLPEVRLDLLPTSIGAQGIYQKGSLSAAALSANSTPDPGLWTQDSGLRTLNPELRTLNSGGSTVTTQRLDAYYALYRPIALNKNNDNIAAITPIVGARATYYTNATGGDATYVRYLGEIGFDAEAHLAGTFAYTNEKWGINGLRHLLTPRLSYRYIPQADKGAPYIPAIDDQTFTTYLQPLGLGDLRNIDQIPPSNTLRVGLDNTLQTRDATYGSRDLAILNLAADYRLDNAARSGEHAFSAVHTTLALMPVRWLTFSLYDSIIPQNLTLRELNTALQLHDGQLWTLTLSTHYLRAQINEYIAAATYRLNETYEAFARLHYDNREQRFNERSFGVIQKLGHNLWTIRYAVTMYQGATRESSFGFSVDVRLMNF